MLCKTIPSRLLERERERENDSTPAAAPAPAEKVSEPLGFCGTKLPENNNSVAGGFLFSRG
jgi:hypothetical protein